MWFNLFLDLLLSRWLGNNRIGSDFGKNFNCWRRKVFVWSWFFRLFMNLLQRFLVFCFHYSRRSFLVFGLYCRRRVLFMMDYFCFLHRIAMACFMMQFKLNCFFLWLLDHKMDFFLWCLVVSLFVMNFLMRRLFFFDLMMRLVFLFYFWLVMTFLCFFLRLFLNRFMLFFWL